MKIFGFLAATSLATSVLAHPYGDFDSILGKRQQQTNIVLNAPGANGAQPRLEVRQLRDTKPNQWTIFLVTLRRWMDKAASDQSSYAAISGIHGVPRLNYNNVGQCNSCGGTDGYCCHDSVHFPAWHRTYVALFEQEFLKVAKQVASEYPASTRAAMQGAANSLRWPYWDWAAKVPSGRPAFPAIFTDVTVTVQGPTGQQTFTNPLYRYDFKGNEQSNMFYGPFTDWTKTYRYPNSNSASASSNNGAVASAYSNGRQNLQDQVYQLFTNCKDYLHFSNDDAGSSSTSCSNSIETVHNTVHTTVGGGGSNGVSGGHMTYLPTAAFDLVFWLHHCNVDRIFAMWQTLNPNSFGATQTAPHSTWTIAQGSSQNANSPLTPFKKNSAGNFYTTNDVKDWKIFGYTYPEFINSAGDKAAITNYVNKLYGPNANAVAGSSKRDAEAEPVVPTLARDILPGNPLVASNGSLFQYVCNIHTPRYALNGSYIVYLFNGKPCSEDPTTWPADTKLIGPMGVMATDGMTDSNLIAAGSVPLTRTLQSIVGTGLLSALTEAIVVPFLTKNLEWRISQDGKSVDPSTIEGFVVAVYASTAQRPADQSELPVYSDFIELLDVTKGQAGGANSTQQATAASSGNFSRM